MHAGRPPVGRSGCKAHAVITGQVGAGVSAQLLGISREVLDAVRAALGVGATRATLNAPVDDISGGAKARLAASC